MKIKEATLLNGETLTFGDFNVFIGGNGVGKTTFLLELFTKSNGVSRSKYHWMNEPFFDSTDTKADMKLLKSSLARKGRAQIYFISHRQLKILTAILDLMKIYDFLIRRLII